MKTVYVVTAGAYSDYRICCIFSTYELAQKYIDKSDFSHWDDARIEEYDVDDNADWVLSDILAYSVLIYKESADVRVSIQSGMISEERYKEHPYFYHFIVHAKDKEHAAKIAMERRSMILINEN